MRNLTIVAGNDRQAEMREEFGNALAQLPECDSMLIIMQKKEGGIIYFAPGTMRLETLVFMTAAFTNGVLNLGR